VLQHFRFALGQIGLHGERGLGQIDGILEFDCHGISKLKIFMISRDAAIVSGGNRVISVTGALILLF
jgi:hypothetical protein